MEEQQPPRLTLPSLERRTNRLERRLKVTTYGWLLTVAVGVVYAAIRHAQATTRRTSRTSSSKPADVLRVRELIVVDENGVERVVIAAPLPDPVMEGQRRRRRTAASGVQLNDASGNERGGIVMLDDGSLVVGIDDEKGRERAHLFYLPSRGAGLILRDEQGSETVSLPDTAQE